MVLFKIQNCSSTIFSIVTNKKNSIIIVFFNVWGDYENIIMGSLKRLEKQLDLLLEYMRITVVTNLQGEMIEVLPGDLRIMPNGEAWFLKQENRIVIYMKC